MFAFLVWAVFVAAPVLLIVAGTLYKGSAEVNLHLVTGLTSPFDAPAPVYTGAGRTVLPEVTK